MPEMYEKEDAEIDRVRERGFYALGGGMVCFAGGVVALVQAGPTDVHLIGGGYAAIVSFVILAALAVGLYHIGRIMAREQRHYRCVFDRLGETRRSIELAVTDEVAQHRHEIGG